MWGVGVQAIVVVLATMSSLAQRQQQTVRNLSARLLRPDKKRQTPKLPVECETQHL